jgi:hypothetical protein
VTDLIFGVFLGKVSKIEWGCPALGGSMQVLSSHARGYPHHHSDVYENIIRMGCIKIIEMFYAFRRRICQYA